MNVPEYLLEHKDQIKFFEVKAEKPEKLKEERAIVHYISTSDLDRGRDIVNPKGMDDKDFQKSPAVWYNHEYRYNDHALPVAKSLWRKPDSGGVLAKTQFATTEFADDVYRLHEGEFMNTWSIGWMPRLDADGNIKQGALEFDEKKNITKINEWSLFEYSSAPMAMNPDAGDKIKALAKMNFKSHFTKSLIQNAELELKMNEVIKDLKSEVQSIANLKTLIENLIEKTENNEQDILELTKMYENKSLKFNKYIKESVETSAVSDDQIKNIVKKITGGDVS